MKLPRRYSLRFLLISVTVMAVAIAYWLNRGWTVAKVERLIAQEFNPDWDRFDVAEWIQSHDFDLDGAESPGQRLGLKSTKSQRSPIQRLEQSKESEPLKPDDIHVVVRARIGPEHGANVGPFSSGEIDMFFYFDGVGRFIKHAVIAYPTGDPATPPKPPALRGRKDNRPRGEV